MSPDPHAPNRFEGLAAEHVMGLLEGEEARRAERLEQEDPGFAAAVERWRLRFGELDATAPAHAPPPDLLARISATLDAAEPEAPPQPESAPARAARPAPLAALWRSLGFWRATGLAGAAASLLLVIGIAFGPLGRLPQPQMVAVLIGPQGEPAALVNAFADGTADLIPLRTIAVPEGRVLEVWTLWDPARGPVSIGLSNEARRIRLDLKNLPRTAPNQLFEITLEPQGGSPIGRPTGPILMKGTTSVAL
ncbi:anti-sigma factor [Aquabacter spiritensis]|uniref:Anti-sigma-K factor RskA n=1 Tax=Aquabacter spiritensis TaxID=933073 RepID=A0A4R3M534_9HYPH|nr:anti-sigma factor [Aquabacter spiritensis]TCT08132.1 anti-sigma-K factor RskA [Aquabacter spiritensis]